ncbi:MAG: sensor histidine kinase [Microthrixaceae bacterium]
MDKADDPARPWATDLDAPGSMRRFFDLSLDLLAVLDLDTTILAASASFESTLGWRPSEIVGRPLLEFFHPDDMPRINEELAGLLQGEDASVVVVRVLCGNGAYRWVQGNARSDLTSGRIYVTAAEITERMRLEESLRHHLALEELVASIASRLIGADQPRILEEIEKAMAELAQAMGADRGHFLRGQRGSDETTYVEWRNMETSPREHAPAPDPEVQRWWRDALRGSRLLRLDDVEDLAQEAPHVVAAMRDDGVRSLLHVPLSPYHGHWGFLTMVAVRDRVSFGEDASALLRLAGECFMTALGQADDAVALQDARDQLERRNRELERTNEELEGFAHSAAHDLKAPLALVEMALTAAPNAGQQSEELLGIARRAATRMRQLIEDLLTFAAAGSAIGAPEPVDLDRLLDHVLVDLEPVIAACQGRIERTPLGTVPGHRALLGQLLQNLVSNALKFARAEVPPLVRVDADVQPDGVTVRVLDNGIGIDPAHRAEVFGVFTRLNAPDDYPGSGIGLATCAKVVQHHAGRIWIEDGIDGGTAVLVWLPLAQASNSS